jgi:hypothetical protein
MISSWLFSCGLRSIWFTLTGFIPIGQICVGSKDDFIRYWDAKGNPAIMGFIHRPVNRDSELSLYRPMPPLLIKKVVFIL